MSNVVCTILTLSTDYMLPGQYCLLHDSTYNDMHWIYHRPCGDLKHDNELQIPLRKYVHEF